MTSFKLFMSGTKEALTNSIHISDDNSPSLWCEGVEPDPAVKQKGKSGLRTVQVGGDCPRASHCQGTMHAPTVWLGLFP